MKRFVFVSISTLLFFALPPIRSTKAVDNDGPSANGSFQFVLEDGNSRYVEFNGRLRGNDGRGSMSFSDPTAVIETDNGPISGVQVQTTFDCMRIDGNRAVMGGIISSSNILSAVGHRVLLVVEDNGEGVNQPAPDRLTWGIYQNPATGWIPKDDERDDDNGAYLSWIATDAERSDDVGIPSNRNPLVACSSFSLSAYSFVDVAHGSGNIQVKP